MYGPSAVDVTMFIKPASFVAFMSALNPADVWSCVAFSQSQQTPSQPAFLYSGTCAVSVAYKESPQLVSPPPCVKINLSYLPQVGAGRMLPPSLASKGGLTVKPGKLKNQPDDGAG